MSWWVAGSVVAGSLISSSASKSAANTQAAAANNAAQLTDEQFQQTRQDQMPWLQAGARALNKLEGAADYTPFSYNAMTADPGYAFRLSEGQKALDRAAAARGGLISGSALKAAERYGQDMGSQEYTNAFNRYQQERAAKLQPLQSLAGVGQTTAANLGAAGAANANAMGNYLTGGAAASAAGTVGQANALNQGVSTYLNYNQGNTLINALSRNKTGGGATGQFESDINTYGFNG
jgi:hypothetical protein